VSVLDPAGVRNALTQVPEWRCRGSVIRRSYLFVDFSEAMAFVNKVAALAEEAGHHPDIDIRWNRVTLRLTTHSRGGLTRKDFSLARKIDRIR